MKEKIIYLLIVASSIAVLLFANLFIENIYIEESDYISATVTEIIEIFEYETIDGVINQFIFFYARTSNGEIVEGEQRFTGFLEQTLPEVAVGDRVLLLYDRDGFYEFAGYVRTMPIYILTSIFIISILIFGRKKGFNALLSLALTIACIFFVLIPAIMGGANIRIAALLVCAYSIISNILIVEGFTKKGITAIISCSLSIILTGAILMIIETPLRLSGLASLEASLLQGVVDLNAVTFAAILIGSLGAIMDIAVSISSSLWEVSEASEKTFVSIKNSENKLENQRASVINGFKQSVKSGINIGKDILGTMLNTLVLAYIGSYLVIVLSLVHNSSIINYEFFNREQIIVEFLRILIGSIGIFITIPISTFVCAFIYNRNVILKHPRWD
ncbi:MAG: YibE/F family protein [Defluviitaleaceae bacterium]|nr:YibE/F family protein [Defluviitaleaceae bacterium]